MEGPKRCHLFSNCCPQADRIASNSLRFHAFCRITWVHFPVCFFVLVDPLVAPQQINGLLSASYTCPENSAGHCTSTLFGFQLLTSPLPMLLSLRLHWVKIFVWSRDSFVGIFISKFGVYVNAIPTSEVLLLTHSDFLPCCYRIFRYTCKLQKRKEINVQMSLFVPSTKNSFLFVG